MRRRIVIVVVVMLLVVSMILVVPMTHAEGATIWTDKSDYSLGEASIISGSGFLSNTTVTVTITRPDSTVDTIPASTDEYGTFSCIYPVDGITGTHTVTATDGTNTATTTFTDSRPIQFMESGLPLEGNGTHFQLNNSQYLNITLDSSEPIRLVLESVPEMVTMHIESISNASSIIITLSGFPPLTTYYKYEDDYHNEASFTTDASGSYTYTQNLAEPHIVFIQPRGSTIYLSDSGWSKPVGTWDPATRTATLTQNVTETIQIDSNNIILDGNGYTITGSNTGIGVYLVTGRTGVTINNLKAKQFATGIYLRYSSNNTLTGNTASNNNNYGILFYNSSNNTLTGNTASNNSYYGIFLYQFCSNNTLTGNTASNTTVGIYLYYYSSNNTLTGNTALNNYGIYNSNGIFLDQFCSNNTLTGNTALNNGVGIFLNYYSSSNTLTGNTVSNNNQYGIYLNFCSNNTLTGNTASNNSYYGIFLDYGCCSNTLAGNTASNNYGVLDTYGIGLGYGSSSNTLTGNTVSNNKNGIYLSYYSSNNKIYNNNFISNIARQAYVGAPSTAGNLFNLPAPTGGNYWSNWTTPDNNNDGFVDYPYVFTGGQDNLPWARRDGWLDNIPPTTTISLGGALGLDGWYKSDVTVTLAATDNLGGSGVKETKYRIGGGSWITYTTPFTITMEGTTIVDYYSTDNAGNVETTKSQTIKIDKTAPSGSISINGGAAWTTSTSVTLSLTYSNGPSGVDKVQYSNDGVTYSGWEDAAATKAWTLTSGDGSKTVYYQVRDVAGNVATFSDDIGLDTTLPKTKKALTGINGNDPWWVSNVEVSLTATDNSGSGIKEIHYILDSGTEVIVLGDTASFTISTDGTHTLEHWTVDNAGNEETHVTQTIKIDTTPPVVTLTPERSVDHNGWYNHAVTWTVSGVDNLGGAVTVDGPFTYSGPDSTTASVTGHATDEAGNVGSATVSFQYDATKPVVTITLPPGTYLLNQPGLVATWSATDDCSGVVSPASGTVSIDTNSVGPHTFDVGPVYDVAGNSATATATYSVCYAYSGILQPINPDGSSIFKLGSTVPVKFQLRDANGAFVTNAVAYIYVAKMSNSVDGTEWEDANSTSAATSGNLFRYDLTNNQYIFNLSTKKLSVGTWKIMVLLDDGTPQYAIISLG